MPRTRGVARSWPIQVLGVLALVLAAFAPVTTGDGRGERCKIRGCPTPPAYSLDGKRPAVLCGNHRSDNMLRVEHADRVCKRGG